MRLLIIAFKMQCSLWNHTLWLAIWCKVCCQNNRPHTPLKCRHFRAVGEMYFGTFFWRIKQMKDLHASSAKQCTSSHHSTLTAISTDYSHFNKILTLLNSIFNLWAHIIKSACIFGAWQMEICNVILEIPQHGDECMSQNLLHDVQIMYKFKIPHLHVC